MTLGITNGKITGIYNAGTGSHSRLIVEYSSPDNQNHSYTLSTELNDDPETYIGKYLQVEMTMTSGILFNKEWFTDVPL